MKRTKILKEAIGEEAYNLGLGRDPVSLEQFSSVGNYSPLDNRKAVLSKRMTEGAESSSQNLNSAIANAARSGIKGHASAGGKPGDSSFCRLG